MKTSLKYSGLLGLIIFLCTGFVACMPPTRAISHERSVKREVVNVLLAMQTAYEKHQIDEFMVWISEKYHKRAKFRKEVLRDFDSSQDIHLSLLIDQILVGEKGADLKVHWYRTWKPLSNGNVTKREGKARLMFSLNPIRLLFQAGDKPFGPPGKK